MPSDARVRSLWTVPAYLDYVQDPISPETVAAAERQFGITLPATYLRLLEVQNGGYLRATWPDSPHRGLSGIGPSFPSLTLDNGWWRPVNAGPDEWTPANNELLIPFDGEGHWDLCFDYREDRGAEPSITLVDVELEEDRPIAPSFDSFVDGLVDEVEVGAIRVYAHVSIEQLADALGATLGIELEDRGEWDHGYRTFRTRVGEQASWAWLTPNEVPRGFRRSGQVIESTPERGHRLPTDTDCTYLVTFTPNAEEATRAAVADAISTLS